MNTFDLIECAMFLKVHPNTVLQLAASGELPGAKVGRAWVFIEDDVADYLRCRVQEQTVSRKRGALVETVDDRWLHAQQAAYRLVLPEPLPKRRRNRRNPIPKLPDLPE